MSLFDEKKELINQMYIITEEAVGLLCDDSFDNYKKIDKLLLKRELVMEDIDKLDEKIKAEKLSIDDCPSVKGDIKTLLEKIVALDEMISKWAVEQKDDVSNEIKNAKDGMKTINMLRAEIQGNTLDISQ